MTIPFEFLNMPKLRPCIDNKWLICDDWCAPVVDDKIVCVKGGGVYTDGISIPRVAWTITGMHPLSMPGLCFALPHDIVYAAELVKRKQCDDWLIQWALMANVSNHFIDIIYKAVRKYGRHVWGKHTKESIEEARKWCYIK